MSAPTTSNVSTETPADIDARIVAAQTARRESRREDAMAICEGVLADDPENPQALYIIAMLAFERRAVSEAESIAKSVLARRPESAAFHRLRGLIHKQNGDLEEAVASFKRALEHGPEFFEAYRDLVWAARDLTLSAVSRRPQNSATAAVPELDDTRVSVVICSIDKQNEAIVRENYQRLLGEANTEIIVIRDAASLCEGYNRGYKQCTGDVIIFSHDDIEILTPDFKQRLLEHLKSVDIVGVAGTSRLAGPGWVRAGWPHIHGMVVHDTPDHEGLLMSIYGIGGSRVGGIKALDGVFLATTRSAVERIKFDDWHFQGFHLYDVDFTYSAYLANLKLAVACDILLLHKSGGKFDDEWRRFGRRFAAKYDGWLDQTPANRRNYTSVFLDTRENALRFWQTIRPA